jgi:hypothetical protein
LVTTAEDRRCGPWASRRPDEAIKAILAPWPAERPALWLARINARLSAKPLGRLRASIARSQPDGEGE